MVHFRPRGLSRRETRVSWGADSILAPRPCQHSHLEPGTQKCRDIIGREVFTPQQTQTLSISIYRHVFKATKVFSTALQATFMTTHDIWQQFLNDLVVMIFDDPAANNSICFICGLDSIAFEIVLFSTHFSVFLLKPASSLLGWKKKPCGTAVCVHKWKWLTTLVHVSTQKWQCTDKAGPWKSRNYVVEGIQKL